MGCRSLALTIALASLGLLSSPLAADEIPDAARTALRKAPELELFSLKPDRLKDKPKDGFCGYAVLGKTTIKDEETRKKIAAALVKGAEENKGRAAFCFNPRHGVRATYDGKTFDLLICFECFQVKVFQGDKEDKGYLTERSPQATLDAVLKEAKVPLPEKSK